MNTSIKFLIISFFIFHVSCFSSKNSTDMKNKTATYVASAPNGLWYALGYNTGEIIVVGDQKMYKTNTKGYVKIETLIFIDDTRFLFGDELGRLYLWDKGERTRIHLSKKIGKIRSISFTLDSLPQKLSSSGVELAKTMCFGGSKGIALIGRDKLLENIILLKDDDILLNKEGFDIHQFNNNNIYSLNNGDLNKDNPRFGYMAHIKDVDMYDISPDEQYIVFSRGKELFVVNNARNLGGIVKCPKNIQHFKDIKDILFINNSHLFTLSVDGTIKLWNVTNNKVIATYSYNKELNAIHYANGKLFKTDNELPVPIDKHLLMVDEFSITTINTLSDADKAAGQRSVHMKLKRPNEIYNPISISKEDIKSVKIIETKEFNPETATWKGISSTKGRGVKERSLKRDEAIFSFQFLASSIKEYELTFCLGYNALTKYSTSSALKNIVEINYDYFSQKQKIRIGRPLEETLHVLTVGPSFEDLACTSRDAYSIDSLLIAQNNAMMALNGKIYNRNVKKHPLSPLIHSDSQVVSRLAIGGAILNWKKKLLDRTGTALFFISTHGNTETGKLYFKTEADPTTNYDIYWFTELVSDLTLGVNCQNIYIIVDACFSGEAIASMKDLISKKTSENNKKRFVVFTSSGETQTSREDITKFPNGVFTHFLLEGAKNGNADFDNNGEITFNEMHQYINTTLEKTDYPQRSELLLPDDENPPVFLYINK